MRTRWQQLRLAVMRLQLGSSWTLAGRQTPCSLLCGLCRRLQGLGASLKQTLSPSPFFSLQDLLRGGAFGAVELRHAAVVELLLAHGADPTAARPGLDTIRDRDGLAA